VRLEVLTGMSMKITVFWNVTPWRLVDIYRGVGGTFCIHRRGIRVFLYSEDRLSMSSIFLRYVGKHLPGNTPSSRKTVMFTIKRTAISDKFKSNVPVRTNIYFISPSAAVDRNIQKKYLRYFRRV
jgi:hypothetical protein